MQALRKAPHGNAWYGGVFRLNEVEGYRSLFPPAIVDVTSHRIIQPVYEGLIRFAPDDLDIEPCLAEKWTWEPSTLTYTFYIRRNVYFHPDECFGGIRLRTLTAQDVKFCFDRLCEPGTMNRNASQVIDRIAGARDYYNARLKGRDMPQGVPGVRVLSKYMLQVRLTHPYGSFLKLLGTAYTKIYPPEAYQYYGVKMNEHCVGTGPFQVTSISADGITMQRNNHYWQQDSFGNRLPYLDGIKITLDPNRKNGLMAFTNNQLDMVYGLPSSFRNHIIDSAGKLTPDFSKYKLLSTPVMTAQYYCFQETDSVFSNPLVRKAFCLAIDRHKIVSNILKNAGVPGLHGVVPPVFELYPAAQIQGYDYDPAEARRLLAQAGYPAGKKFPVVTLHISSNGSEYQDIAQAVQSMLFENLNVQIRIESTPWAKYLEDIEKGKYAFYRFAWQADYPDPESFLNQFYSKNLPENKSDPVYADHFHYVSPVFDNLFIQAQSTQDELLRMRLLAEASQKVMDDAAVMVLYYPVDYVILQPYVHNFKINPMQTRDYTRVYFEK